jgi:hypothetical protein
MRPVRFVALSEDGQALVLTDEVGRLLALPIDPRVSGAIRGDRPASSAPSTASPTLEDPQALSPRDIQARIRSGDSADEVARIAGVPVDRVLRYAGPVLQERAMLAQHARRTKIKSSDQGASLAEVVDGRLAQHGIEAEKISWDAFRREDGTWRIVATWPSGKATAQAVWELDKTRQAVLPHDDMARYLCGERPATLPSDPPAGRSGRGGHGLPGPGRDGRTGEGSRREARSPRDPIRSGRDALLASLDRPLGTSGRGLDPAQPVAAPRPGGAAALLGGPGSAFDDDPDQPKEVPAVPSLAVLRPRRSSGAGAGQGAEANQGGTPDKPRKRLPSWDDVLFGTGPAARESS